MNIIRTNLDWLTVSVVNLLPVQMSLFDDLSDYFNLKVEDYKLRGHLFSSGEDVQVQSQDSAGYIIIDFKPKYFWLYLPELQFDENYYIAHVLNIFKALGYKIFESQLRFNRVDIAIDYTDDFSLFDDTFKGIKRSRKFSVDSIRNVGNSLLGRSSYLNGVGNKWQFVRYEKTKELKTNYKAYYPAIYYENNVNRLEIRINKEYIKQYSKKRNILFPLFKKLIDNIDDIELNELKIFDSLDDVKSIKNDIKGVYMNLKEKLLNEIQEKITLLTALENTYNNTSNDIELIIDNLKKEILTLPKLQEKEKYYRRYLKVVNK
jgi:hypothetical protein